MLIVILAAALLAACAGTTVPGGSESLASPTATLAGVLLAYHTPTPGPAPTARPPLPTAQRTGAPSPTPFVHVIEKGDTLLAVAATYGISLEKLMAANPGISPNLLTVGEKVVIPLSGDLMQSIPTATPAPVSLAQPVCYPAGDGGLWCLALVYNDQPWAVENLSAWIELAPAGEEFVGEEFVGGEFVGGEFVGGEFVGGEAQLARSELAVSALNVLQPGAQMPLLAYFAAPLPSTYTTGAGLVTALSLVPGDARYLSTAIQLTGMQLLANDRQARLQGTVQVDGENTARWLWLALVAYDSRGQAVGLRKWESPQPCPPRDTGLPGCAALTFDVTVYSLGPPIDHVTVLAEARP